MLHEVGITVEEVLTLPAFSGAKVVGGQQGLGRVVTNVNVMEVPDIVEWIREGDLLLTTGYPIKDDLEAQKALLPRLAAKDVAAVAFKPKRYIDVVPGHMVNAADEHGLPLLELPLEVSFSELISAVLAQIVNRQSRFVQLGMAVHRKFMDLIVEGGGLEEIAGALADLLKAVVLVEDSLNLRRALAGQCWGGSATSELIQVLLGRPSELVATETFTDTIEGTVLSFQREQVEGDGYRAEVIRVPLTSASEQLGHIKAVKFEGSFSVLDLLNLERLCPLISFDVFRHHGLVQVEQKYCTEFLDQLFSTERPDQEKFAARGKTFGWDLSLEYVAAIFDVRPGDRFDSVSENERACQLAKAQATTILADFCRRNRLRHILTSHASGILLFLHPEGVAAQDVATWVDGIIKRARKNIQRWAVTCGIGCLGKGVDGLRKTYREARAALELGRTIYGEGRDIHYEALGVYRLLLGRCDAGEQKRFAVEVVDPLRAYDASRGGELLKTLETYLQANGNAKKTASLLFTHYNTVLYRLNKIKQLTGLDPCHPDQRLTLQTALRLFRVYGSGDLGA